MTIGASSSTIDLHMNEMDTWYCDMLPTYPNTFEINSHVIPR